MLSGSDLIGAIPKMKKALKIIIYTVGIIGIIVLLVILIPNRGDRSEPDKDACRAQLRCIQSALEQYYGHYKYYPRDLDVLVKESYLSRESLIDPWGSKCRYDPLYGKEAKQPTNYRLGSCGPDKKPDTGDDIEPPIWTKDHSFHNGLVNGDRTPQEH